MICADVDELLPGLVLGAATPQEERDVQQHLATCDRHAQLANFQEVAAMLPLSIPPSSPRAQVKHRLMARIYTDLEPGQTRERWWRRPWSWIAAAVLALVALGLGIRDWVVSGELARAPVTWQLSPTVTGVTASGTVVYLPQQKSATLMLQQLPALAPGRVYEVWLIHGGTPQPEGVFSPAPDGSASVVLKSAPVRSDVVAVTEEPGPNGSAAPTAPPFVAGPLK